MKTIIQISMILAAFYSNFIYAGMREGNEALKQGNYQRAYEEILPIAKAGNTRAMIAIGMLYFDGKAVAQDYRQAMQWFIEAFDKGDANVYNIIGVMYRDGLGVASNRKIAYDLFLIPQLAGLGSQETQTHLSQNIRREMTEQNKTEISEALCYTQEYIREYVLNFGNIKDVPTHVLPTAERLRLRDKSWWTKDEKENMTFSCPAPWN